MSHWKCHHLWTHHLLAHFWGIGLHFEKKTGRNIYVYIYIYVNFNGHVPENLQRTILYLLSFSGVFFLGPSCGSIQHPAILDNFGAENFRFSGILIDILTFSKVSNWRIKPLKKNAITSEFDISLCFTQILQGRIACHFGAVHIVQRAAGLVVATICYAAHGHSTLQAPMDGEKWFICQLMIMFDGKVFCGIIVSADPLAVFQGGRHQGTCKCENCWHACFALGIQNMNLAAAENAVSSDSTNAVQTMPFPATAGLCWLTVPSFFY